MMGKQARTSPFLSKGILFVLLMVAALSGVSCKPAQPAAPAIPLSTVMQAVREYGHGAQPMVPKVLAAPASHPSRELDDADGAYQAHIALIFVQGDFAQLEKEAQKVRSSKARLTGAVWKLFGLYEGVARPSAAGHATEADWNAHVASFKKWIAAYPESATARIALANAYVAYAYAGRGEGYADTVTRTGWKLYGQRIELAKATLLEAARLKEKCPNWYGVMQDVALAEGWDKSKARELFDQAVEFDPSFLQFYRAYAYFHLPKWYGEPGEAERFAEEISQKIPGPEGDIIYFEIASEIACQYDLNRSPLPNMSWEKIKAGYFAIDRIYGQSNLKANRFAFMAYLFGDKPDAQEALAFIGDHREPMVWDKGQFAYVKAWASNS
jgi:tetratricopeptide (TPR) repeat protein